jgi:nicotinamidase/pyrazinamidase
MSDGLTMADFDRDFEENKGGKNMGRALILVDIQKDFMKGGSLEVPNASEILPVVNGLMENHDWDLVVATKDWHPAYHKSFASQHDGKNVFDVIDLNGVEQVLWPNHCIQGSKGAEIHDEIHNEHIDEFIVKGTNELVDSYSGFFDNGQVLQTDLADILDDNDIDKVYIVGLATDYCVKFTALDSADLGFETYVITDGVRGLDGAEAALKEMADSGVYLTTLEAIY